MTHLTKAGLISLAPFDADLIRFGAGFDMSKLMNVNVFMEWLYALFTSKDFTHFKYILVDLAVVLSTNIVVFFEACN